MKLYFALTMFFLSTLFSSCSCNGMLILPEEVNSPIATFNTFKQSIKEINEKLWKAYNILTSETRKKYSYDEFAYTLKKHDYAETFCELIIESEIKSESTSQNSKIIKIIFEDLELDLKFSKTYNETTKAESWLIDFDFDRDLPQLKYHNNTELEPQEVFELYKKSLSEGIYWNAYLFIKPPKEKILPTYKIFFRALTKTEKGRLYLENIKNAEIIRSDKFIKGDVPYTVIEAKWGNGTKKFALIKPEEFWVVLFTFDNALDMNIQEVDLLKLTK